MCSRCLSVSYCGNACAQKDWIEGKHYMECLDNTRKLERGKHKMLGTKDIDVFVIVLSPFEALDTETHPDTTQLFQVLQGSGTATVDQKVFDVNVGLVFVVPRNTEHSVKAGAQGLRLLTSYSPAEHTTIIKKQI